MMMTIALALSTLLSGQTTTAMASQTASPAVGLQMDIKADGSIEASMTSGTLGSLLSELTRRKAIVGLILDERVRGLSLSGAWSASSAEELLRRVLAGRTDVAFAGNAQRIAVGQIDFVLKAWDVKDSMTGGTTSAPSKVRLANEKEEIAPEEQERLDFEVREEAARSQETALAQLNVVLAQPALRQGEIGTLPFPGPNGEPLTYIQGPPRPAEVGPRPFARPGSTPQGVTGNALPPAKTGLEALLRDLGVK
ncbi:MAG: hypothetical protein ABI672_00880 [Vicinamibacteria bacterium]